MKKIIFLIVLTAMISFGYFSQTPTELIVNGGFEQSKSLYPWVVETTKGGVLVSGPNKNGNPHGGNRYVTLGGTNKEVDVIEQSLIVPQNLESLTLSFAMKIKSTGNDKTPHDFLKVIVKGETLNDMLVQYSNVNSCVWQTISIPNLTSYAGKLITLRFEASTDGTKPTKFMIDDVSLIYTAGQGTPTPNLEFISPHFGCVYPISTITGAAPFTVLADAPNGIESLTLSIDGEIVASTTDKRLDVPINWSNLTPGPHTLEAELIDPIGERKLKRCEITSSNLLEGADFENDAFTFWDVSSSDVYQPMIYQSANFAYSGSHFVGVGTQKNCTQGIEQYFIIPEDAEDLLTLSFFYQSLSISVDPLTVDLKDPYIDTDISTKFPISSTKNYISVYIVEAETGQSHLIATIYPSSIGWNLCRIPISISQNQLCAGMDYFLKFEAKTSPNSNDAGTFYLDDIVLYVYSNSMAQGIPPNPPQDPDPDEATYDPSKPTPFITQVNPNIGPKEGGNFVEIDGGNFDPAGVRVKFVRMNYNVNPPQRIGAVWVEAQNCSTPSTCKQADSTICAKHTSQTGHHETTIYTITPSCIYMTAPSSFDGKYGDVRVVVKNLSSKNTGKLDRAYHYGFPPPTITSVVTDPSSNPPSGVVTGGTKVIISGTNFVSGSRTKISFGDIDWYPNSNEFSNCSNNLCSKITTTIPTNGGGNWCCSKSQPGKIGYVDVKVTNPDNISGTLSNAFTFTLPPQPSFTSDPNTKQIDPNSGKSAGGTSVTLTGSNFNRVTKVNFGNAEQTNCSCASAGKYVYVNSPTLAELDCKSATMNSVSVKVATKEGYSAPSSESFTYLATEPTLWGYSPDKCDCDNGGTYELTMNIIFNKGPSCEALYISSNNITVSFNGPQPSGCSANSVSDYLSLTGASVENNLGQANVVLKFHIPGSGSNRQCLVKECYPRNFNISLPLGWSGNNKTTLFNLSLALIPKSTSPPSSGYSISGRVTIGNSIGLSNWEMDLTGVATKTTFTDVQGYYNFNSLSNGSYSVSPKWELGDIYQFYPSSIVVSVNGQNVENVNFTAKKIIIKGTVADSSGKGIEGIKMKVGDIESYTNEEGVFSFSGLCPGEYILEPSNEAKTNFTFSPPNRKIVINENDYCHDHQNFNVKRK